MSQFPQSKSSQLDLDYARDRVGDKTIFNFFNTVYAWMAVGLAVTAAVGYVFSQNDALRQIVYGNRFGHVAIVLGAFAIAWSVQSAAARIGATAATALFILYAAVIGALISGIFRVYPIQTLASAFLVTGGTFAGMSFVGFVLKRDLTKIGSYLIMAFWGLFIASMVNIFMQNDAMGWVITYGVLIVFIGLTAYQTQKLKVWAEQSAHDGDAAGRMAIVGALILYVAFINIFLSILRIMGSRR